jgi:hypothetical protein
MRHEHPSPATFPDPLQRIGTPVMVPHGHKPNPAYQDLLTLYAKVYGAEEKLATAFHPARRLANDGEAWIGHAAKQWTTDLDDWNRRLDHAGDMILQELVGRLRNTSPYVLIGTTDPNEPGGIQPGGTMSTGPNPGGQMYPGGLNPGGPMRVPSNPGGQIGPGPNPGGQVGPGGANPGGPMHHEPDPGGRMGVPPNPGGQIGPSGANPGGTMHHVPDPGGRMRVPPNPGGQIAPGPNPGGQMHHEPDPGGVMHHEPDPDGLRLEDMPD